MKVLMLLDNPFLSDSRVEKEINSFVKAGFFVSLLAYKKEEVAKKEEKDGALVERILDPILSSPFRRGYKEYLKNTSEVIALRDFDVLYCHDVFMLLLGTQVKRVSKKAFLLVYDAHEYISGVPTYLAASNFPGKVKGYFVWSHLVRKERDLIKSADIIITVSQKFGELFSRNLNPKMPVFIVRNLPESSKTKIKNEKRENGLFEKENGELVLAHTGSIYFSFPEIKILIREIERVQTNFKLFFLGDNASFRGLQDYCKANLKEYSEKVIFLPYVKDFSERINLLSQADVGLMFVQSKWLGHRFSFANKFMEYCAAELPTLSTPQDECEKINGKFHFAEFFGTNNFQGIELALKKILKKPQQYKEAAKKAKGELVWEKEISPVVDFLNTAINE